MTDVGILKPGTAIPTTLKGQTYRSRLEANVAQFLMDLGLKFEYESQSFLVNGQHYCPDFYLPEMDRYVEARGYVTETSESTLASFVKLKGDLFVFYSDVADHIQMLNGELVRSRLAVCLCDLTHSIHGTLGYPSLSDDDEVPCYVCRKYNSQNPTWKRMVYMSVLMRSSVPTLVIDNVAFEAEK